MPLVDQVTPNTRKRGLIVMFKQNIKTLILKTIYSSTNKQNEK